MATWLTTPTTCKAKFIGEQNISKRPFYFKILNEKIVFLPVYGGAKPALKSIFSSIFIRDNSEK